MFRFLHFLPNKLQQNTGQNAVQNFKRVSLPVNIGVRELLHNITNSSVFHIKTLNDLC